MEFLIVYGLIPGAPVAASGCRVLFGIGQFVFPQVASQLMVGHAEELGGFLLVETTLLQRGLEQIDLGLLDMFLEVAGLARLAALVPRPRLNLTHFHGVFAPNFKHRKCVGAP